MRWGRQSKGLGTLPIFFSRILDCLFPQMDAEGRGSGERRWDENALGSSQRLIQLLVLGPTA